jgi:hypothetical protein
VADADQASDQALEPKDPMQSGQPPRSLPPIPIKRSRGLIDDPNAPMPRTGYYPWKEPPPGHIPPYVDENGVVCGDKPLKGTTAPPGRD